MNPNNKKTRNTEETLKFPARARLEKSTPFLLDRRRRHVFLDGKEFDFNQEVEDVLIFHFVVVVLVIKVKKLLINIFEHLKFISILIKI